MSDLVPPGRIENIVGHRRHKRVHYGRAVSAEQTVYILQSHECADTEPDLRDCDYSVVLDDGIDMKVWRGFEDEAVTLWIENGRLMPLGKPRAEEWPPTKNEVPHLAASARSSTASPTPTR